MPDSLFCPYCRGPLTHYGTGQSEYDWQCDACGAAVRVEGATVHTRRWDRQAARGVHEELPLDRLEMPA